MNQADLARVIAEKIHAGQFDKGGQPYFQHVNAVAEGVSGDVLKAAGFLHDALEDTDMTTDRLLELGVKSSVIDLVELLTRKPDEKYQDYIRRISLNRDAARIKLSDLRHNSDLSRIAHPSVKDRVRQEKYLRSIEFLEKALTNE
ncbi:GTP pyrophosphokinase [Faecalibaculum rodentium]|uniref:GTP pyrophosphokinase n=1 Tax=Faecalibaculum rodentium TaxID=1702221 RepID=UPI0023F4E0EA|nr:GTP pyrophosphokinase [Faecalibaculum rodentium]